MTRTRFQTETAFIDRIETGPSLSAPSVQNLAFDFDTLGNLKYRADANRNLTESFTYDGLNRLSMSTVHTPQDDSSVTVKYDLLGNIVSKSDVGDYSYGASAAGPHAVTSIRNGPKDFNYSYDAAGNQLSNGERTLTYSSFNKPTEIRHSNGAVVLRSVNR